jgi:hypothetical protein
MNKPNAGYERNVETMARKEEKSVRELFFLIKALFSYLLGKWKIVILFLIIGSCVGALYSKLSKVLYSAGSTFVLDEGNSGGSLSSLALIGVDVGDKNAGLFTDMDNIIWLYSSPIMLQNTLLSPVNVKGQHGLMIDWFIIASDLKKEIDKNKSLRNIRFDANANLDSLSIEQISLLNWCVSLIKKDLIISPIAKTRNIITVTYKSKNELFAKAFNDALVQNVNSFYIKTKTLKTTKEVQLLQAKADSIRGNLNVSMYAAADLSDAVPYANPNMQTLRVQPQKKGIDIGIESKIYTEVKTNLEATKMALAKETPLIQMLEAPRLPLQVISVSLTRGVSMGALILGVMSILGLVIRFWFKKVITLN